jgi:hypothetical protein
LNNIKPSKVFLNIGDTVVGLPGYIIDFFALIEKITTHNILIIYSSLVIP